MVSTIICKVPSAHCLRHTDLFGTKQEKQQLGEALARCKDAHAQDSKQHAAELIKLQEQVRLQSLL